MALTYKSVSLIYGSVALIHGHWRNFRIGKDKNNVYINCGKVYNNVSLV